MKFFGREKELEILKSLKQKKTASLIVIKGRRRIGKSRLVQEFSKQFDHFLEFSGLPPEKDIQADDQRAAFAKQLEIQAHLPGLKSNDWTDLFTHLANHTQQGSHLILLDEISWMANSDSTFLGKLKTCWDQKLSKNPNLVLVICGSISLWIQENILSSTGFVGRISLDMTIEELPLKDCIHFFHHQKYRITGLEILKILSVTGGVPRYLEEIQPKESAEHNITRLCFLKESLLFNEFEKLFFDLFERRAISYKAIVQTLADQALTQDEIIKKLNLPKGGNISKSLEELQAAGFIRRDFDWHFNTGQLSKLSKYRLKDNYCRFYLKYIEKNKHRIENNLFTLSDYTSLPYWESTLGLQFENLVLNNRSLLFDALKLNSSKLIFDNPYFQKPTKTHPGCQIDYLIQDRFNTLYLIEIKFSKNPITTKIIPSIEKKINALSRPKGMSVRPILVVAGEVEPELTHNGYFDHIISFSDYLR